MITVAVLMMTETAVAQPTYTSIGSSCGTWIAMRRDRRALGGEQWVLGFLSGVGFLGVADGWNLLKGVDANGVWAWIDNYCQANPLKDLAAGGWGAVRVCAPALITRIEGR